MALAYRVAPWLCGLMDSVLSVEGSQIYRQSAFNKKQVARKVHCRATKDVNTSKTASTRVETLIVEGPRGVCLWCDKESRRTTPRASGHFKMQAWMMNGRMEFPMQPSNQAAAAASFATAAYEKVVFKRGSVQFIKIKVARNVCTHKINVVFGSAVFKNRF